MFFYGNVGSKHFLENLEFSTSARFMPKEYGYKESTYEKESLEERLYDKWQKSEVIS